MKYLIEGGNAIPESQPVDQEDVALVVDIAKESLPEDLLKNLQLDIGSAGYKKVPSGDIDLMVEASDVIELFQTSGSKNPLLDAKKALAKYFSSQGIESNVNGRNVSIGIKYQSRSGKPGYAQVDVMVIEDAALVAPWHQHGPRGMYSDPEFKGSANFILMNSIAKYLGLKFDAFSAKLLRRDDNSVVGRTRDEVAKILLGPGARASDLDSVKSMMAKLATDPDKEGKLAQARQDQEKGLLLLPEEVSPGTAAWFRKLSDRFTLV